MESHACRRWTRPLQGLCLSGSLVVAAACGDQPTAAPRQFAAGHARFAVRPEFATLPPGSPAIILSRVTGILIGPNGDSTIVTATFNGDSAVLVFNVQITGTTAGYKLDLTAFDAQGVVAYHNPLQDVIVKAGDNSPVVTTLLVYAAPDTAVKALHVNPSALVLNAGASAPLGATGTGASGQTVPLLRVGWTSRDASVATVDDDGTVHAGASQGTTWVVARTATNFADSASVKVHAPVSSVVVTPPSVQIIRGQSAPVSAALRDAANHVIDDRTATWTSSDPTVATVSATGVVQAISIGTATVTASAEGKTATGAVTVVSPIDHIELTPTTLTFASLHETKSVSARLVARAGGSVAGLSPVVTSTNTSVATIDANGVVTAAGNGSATIKASVDGLDASIPVTVKQVATSLTVTPTGATILAIGDTRTFVAAPLDALGNPLPAAGVTWSSSNPTVASVSATGIATGLTVGTAFIVATADGVSASATFVVAQSARVVLIASDHDTIQVGQTATLTGRLADANGNPIGNGTINATWSTTTPTLVSVQPDGHVTGRAPGRATITASAAGATGSYFLQITGSPVTLALNVSTVEKLPNGTQQFSVTGSDGPFSWTVNGVVGGNATFGTISATGFYTAPAAVPSPATFDVCAVLASPPASACARVTIKAIPTSGADVIVFNDINMFDNNYGYPYANNKKLVLNLIGFTGPGVRTTQTGILFHRGHHSLCGATECRAADFSGMGTVVLGAGYSVTNVDDPTATIEPIASNIKVVVLLMPTTNYSSQELNNLKQFAGEGGRIIFVGERQPYYGTAGIAIENTFFQNMGAVMRNIGGDYACIYQMTAADIRPHQVTTDMDGVSMACASAVQLGPNDYALVTDHFNSSIVLAAVAKIDLTPLSDGGKVTARRTPQPRVGTSGVVDPEEHSWGRGPAPPPRTP